MTPEDLDVVKAQIDAKIQEKMGERSDAVKPDNDLKKFMYDKNYEELKLSREWAIKVSVFTSAVYFGVITLANSETGKAIVTGSYRIAITILLAVFAGLGIWNIILRHFSYLEYRNIQIRLQNDLGIHSWSHDNGNVFPETWKKTIIFESKVFSRQTGLFKNPSGYLFYGFYLLTISLLTAIVILHVPEKRSSKSSYEQNTRVQDSTIRTSLIKILGNQNIRIRGKDLYYIGYCRGEGHY